MRHLLLTLAVLAPLAASQDRKSPTTRADSQAADWPQWRGPDRDGVAKGGGWSAEGREEALWKAEIGIGYSTVSIADGRLYTMGHDKDAEQDTVFCFDALTGEEIWRHEFAADTLAKMHIGGTLSTPSVGAGLVFVQGRFGKFLCLDAKTGKVRWSKDLGEKYKVKVPTWGLASSPLVLDDMVIANIGRLVAYAAKTGKRIWKTAKDYGFAYSTPVDVTYRKKACLAVFNGVGLLLLDKKNGKPVTSTFKWKTRYDVNAASPVPVGNDRFFISSGYGKGCALVAARGKGFKLLWENKEMRNHMSGCVFFDKHLYGFDESTVKCLDLEGEVKWSRRLGKGALVIADGKLVVLSQRGKLVIAKATPEEFSGISSTQVVSGGVCWTTPVVWRGLIYCRNSLGDLVCRDHRSTKRAR